MKELINKLKEFKASEGDKAAKGMEETIKEAIEQLQEKDKIINIMAEDIQSWRLDNTCTGKVSSINEIIEYFTKKAREV